MSGDFAVTVRRRQGSAMATVTAINPTANEKREFWSTDLSGPVAGVVQQNENQVAVSSQGDVFSLTDAVVQSGYAGKPDTVSSTIVTDLQFSNWIDLGPGKQAFYGPLERESILSIDANRSTGISRLVDLADPANKPSCPPIGFGDHLLIASRMGQVARVNPRNGQIVGTPFQPKVQPGVATEWSAPARIRENELVIADAKAGKLYLLQVNEKDIQSLSVLEHGNPFRSGVLNVGELVVGVDTQLTKDRLAMFTAEETLEFVAAQDLPASFVAGPFSFGDGLILQLANNELVYFELSAEGNSADMKWQFPIENRTLAAITEWNGQSILSFSSGELVVIDAETGEQTSAVELGQPIIGKPVISNGKLLVSGRDGTIHVVDQDKLKP